MAVSKRLRYEVLRRDNFQCRYCGATAPDVKLTVDHVTAVTLGGSDDPSNLVTACDPCNTGKSSSSPDAELVADVDARALRWAQAMNLAIEQRAAELAKDRTKADAFDHEWLRWTADGRPVPRDANWRNSILRFFAGGLDGNFLADAIATSMGLTKVPASEKWRYFCGICWREMDRIREYAAEIADRGIVATDGRQPSPSSDITAYDAAGSFPYMFLFDSLLAQMLQAMGHLDSEKRKNAHESLWWCFEVAFKTYLERSRSGADPDEAMETAETELLDCSGWFLNELDLTRQSKANEPVTVDDFPYMELFDAFLEDIMVSLGATREARRLANRALWNGFPEAHRAYEVTPKPSGEEDDGALEAAKAELMMHMSYYMPHVGLLHKSGAVDA